MKIQLITATVLMAVAMMVGVSSANAEEGYYKDGKYCYSVYGGGERCEDSEIKVMKKAWNPSKNDWDNQDGDVDSSEHTFSAGNDVKFEVKVENTGSHKIEKIIVKDYLPSYLEWKNSGDWYWEVKDLKPGSENAQTREIVVRVKGEGDLPEGITCVTNRAEAYDDKNQSEKDDDTSMVCIKKGTSPEKRVLGVTTLPKTGPNTPWVLALEAMALGVIGMMYLKVSKKYSH